MFPDNKTKGAAIGASRCFVPVFTLDNTTYQRLANGCPDDKTRPFTTGYTRSVMDALDKLDLPE
ncbi:hypothetical protein EAN04_24465 [Salmonella enterica]|nr:hypothetical protein [Salmonella enterica]